MPYFVLFEARPQGAIGVFEHRGISVSAESDSDALDQGRAALNAAGLETRFPVRVYEYFENED